MGSRLSSHANPPDDDSSDDEILLVAPPPPPPPHSPTVPSRNNPRKALLKHSTSQSNAAAATPAKRPRVNPSAEPSSPFLPPPPLLDRKQHSAPRPSSAKVGTKSATKRTLDRPPPFPESPPSRKKRQHTRWTDDTATGGTIASISYANKMRPAAAQPSPPQPEEGVVPDVAAATASASLASTTTRTTPTPRSDSTLSKTKRKRVRSPSFELEIFNPPPSRRRATLSAPIPRAIPTSANPAPPPPPPPPRSVPTTTSSSASVAVLAPARSTVSPDEPNDSNEQREPPANKEVPPASTASRSNGVGDSPLSRRATQAAIRPFDLVAPVVKRSRQSAGSSSGSGLTSSRRPSPPPAGKKSLPSAQTPTPLPFPHKSPSHPLNASLRFKPNRSAPPPPIPVRFLRNDEFEATRGLGGWVMPHPVAAAAAARGLSSRSSTPLPMIATATANATKAAAARPPAATALSFAEWARKRYGFLDPAETSHYKIDGTTLGIDPDVMSYEWDEEELWDAYEERWGWRERERVERGEEGASEEESEEEEDDDEDTDDDGDREGSDSGSEEHQKRSSPPPPRARMAFTVASAATTEDGTGEEATITYGTEIVARLCHLASAAEGAVHPSDRVSALSQLDAMSRQGGVFQVPWRWKSLEEGQGRASNLAGMVDGKGKWATRNPFMRSTSEEEGKSGRGAHRFAKLSATAAVASMQGAGMAGSRPRAAVTRRRTLLPSSTSTSSSRASSVELNPIANVVSAAARPVPAAPPAPLNAAAVTGALYGIDETYHATLGSDMTGFDSAPAPAPAPWVPPVAASARQIPHLGPFFGASSPSSAPHAAAAAESPATSIVMRFETSSEGAAVIRSIHDISNANATSPLLSGGVAPGLSNQSKRGAATASSTIESSRVLPSRPLRPEKPRTTVRSLAGVASASTSGSSTAATSASSSAKESSSSTTSSDRDESGPTSASSSGPEAGPLIARDVHPPPPPPSAPVATVRPLVSPVVPAPPHPTAPATSSANGSRTLAAKASAETPQKPPMVKRATTPSGMVRCNHGGCPSPFYHPQKRTALENHARNFHTPGVTLNYRDPDRAHYLERDPNSGALQCPFCSFWSMNASSTRQHVYRRSDCLGPPVRSRTG